MAKEMRLTLTWDVLKLLIQSQMMMKQHRLTLTWDVLKSIVGIKPALYSTD